MTQLPPWDTVRTLIGLELSMIFTRMMATADTALLHELRGRANALHELLAAFTTASSQLEKIERKPPGRP